LWTIPGSLCPAIVRQMLPSCRAGQADTFSAGCQVVDLKHETTFCRRALFGPTTALIVDVNVASLMELIAGSQPIVPPGAAFDAGKAILPTFQASLLIAQNDSSIKIPASESSDARRAVKADPEEKKPLEVSSEPTTAQPPLLPQVLAQPQPSWLATAADLNSRGVSSADPNVTVNKPQLLEGTAPVAAVEDKPDRSLPTVVVLPLSTAQASSPSTASVPRVPADKRQAAIASPGPADPTQAVVQSLLVATNVPVAVSSPTQAPTATVKIVTAHARNTNSATATYVPVGRASAEPGDLIASTDISFRTQQQRTTTPAVVSNPGEPPVSPAPVTVAAQVVALPVQGQELPSVPAKELPVAAPLAAPPAVASIVPHAAVNLEDVAPSSAVPVKQSTAAPEPAPPAAAQQATPPAFSQAVASASVAAMIPLVIEPGVVPITLAKTNGQPAITKAPVANGFGQPSVTPAKTATAAPTAHAVSAPAGAPSDAQSDAQQGDPTRAVASPHPQSESPVQTNGASQAIAATDHGAASSMISPGQVPSNPAASAPHTAAPVATIATTVAAAVPQAPEVNTARLMQSVGQSDMRVGLHSAEFGDISIRTSATRDLVSAQISLGHDELARTLVTHLPELQARLGGAQPMEVRIDRNGQATGQQPGQGNEQGNAGGAANDSTAGSSNRQQARGGSGLTPANAEPRPTARFAGDGSYDALRRLDITV
jgi:hypothetical protein